ncbi:beta/gamma crystallin-related protein [Phenylobacterium sp.]|uniref:beta/gamma crystallin-related protein n=1 Tax=Phenylobacterium sp. TaxID=1871053 RepID=UPI0030036218
MLAPPFALASALTGVGLALVLASSAAAQEDEITFFSAPDFAGQSFTTREDLADTRAAIPFQPLSAKVTGYWDICGAPEFTNPCTVLRRDTPNFDYVPARVGAESFEVRSIFATYRGVEGDAAAAEPLLELYARREFMGLRLSVSEAAPELEAPGEGGAPLSAHVTGAWQLCEGVAFTGRCVVLEADRIGFEPAELPPVIRSARPAP